MTAEARLRAAIRARTESIEPAPEGWDRIQGRIAMSRTRRSRYLVVPAAAAAVAAVIVGVSLLGGDDRAPVANEPLATTTTEAPTTTTTVAEFVPTVWPDEPGRGYDTPEALAKDFAVAFLGMKSPVISEFRQNEPNAGEIDIHPNPRASIRTLLSIQRSGFGWVVSDARSPSIQLETPEYLQLITSPVKLTGRSIAFEGTVQMTLLEDGQTMTGRSLGKGFFTGHGSELGPFEATLSFSATTQRVGRLVLWTGSGEDGSLIEATVRLVRFSPPKP